MSDTIDLDIDLTPIEKKILSVIFLKFFFIKSPNKSKKYRAVFEDSYYTDFGAIKKDGTPYSQFKDKALGLYSNYNNYDENKKNNYYKRHNVIYPIYSADWFSKKYLW